MAEKPDPKGNTNDILSPSPITVNMYLSLVRAFFRQEVDSQHLERSPFTHVKNRKVLPKKHEYFSISDIGKFFAQQISKPYRRFFAGLLHTGFRFNELASLRWQDVDFGKKLISVVERPGYTPKTPKAIRTIPLSKSLKTVLQEIKAENPPTELVFVTREGNKIRARRSLEKCKAAAMNAGITVNASNHRFRHTYASHLVQSGVRIEVVSRLLGHATLEQTMAYAYLAPEDVHDDLGVLENMNTG